MTQKILFSNIGYAKGIDGTLWQHISRIGRHIYCGESTQTLILKQLKGILDAEQPDLGCFVEIDQGSFHSAYVNQLKYLIDDDYKFFDIANKYGEGNWRGRMPLSKGRSSAFLSKSEVKFDRLYFTHGTKRLMYRIVLPGNIHVFFAHFSLDRAVRVQQFEEVRGMMQQAGGDSILLADFNIMHGFSELDPLIKNTNLKVLSKETDHTFTFHRRKLALDLCICSDALLDRISVRVIPQPFSDHQALLVEVADAHA
jgi:endonuclease/exonuclease/phosphatase family metal-dependent hydrolase